MGMDRFLAVRCEAAEDDAAEQDAAKDDAAEHDAADGGVDGLPISTNTYPWRTHAQRNREGDGYRPVSRQTMQAIRDSGLTAFEPILDTPDQLVGMAEKMAECSLSMPTIYVNSVLHDANRVDASIDNVLATAAAAHDLGARICVTNPSPIRWGGDENKDDAQLRLQAKSLDRLGGGLADLGVTLAYHNHDAEFRQGGREFHHMLTATDPDVVKLCLDSHWIFRGCGDSELAVMDAIAHYGSRTVELHLRQSTEGIYDEKFSLQGDLNYVAITTMLASLGVRPIMVLEQAVEEGSPQTLDPIAAHRASVLPAQTLKRQFSGG